MPPCTAHNIVRRSRECGRISARKGQGRKSVLDARDLWALEGGCIQNRQDSVLEITAWAEDHFQKQDKMRFICTPVGVHRTRTLGCCSLTTVHHSTRSFPTNFPQKLLTLRLTPSLCNCVLDRPQGTGTWTSIIGTVSTRPCAEPIAVHPLLLRLCGECPHQRHHSVVRQLHCPGQEDLPTSRKNCSEHFRKSLPIVTGHLPQRGPRRGPRMDSSHPQHNLFTLLPSTKTLNNSFYPQDIRLLTTTTTIPPFSNTSH